MTSSLARPVLLSIINYSLELVDLDGGDRPVGGT